MIDFEGPMLPADGFGNRYVLTCVDIPWSEHSRSLLHPSDVCGAYPHEWSELLPVVEFLLATTPRDLERAWSMERELEPFTVLEWEPLSEYASDGAASSE